MLIKQSSAVKVLPFLMVDSGDHITGETGLTPTVTLSKNGAAFGAAAGAVAEIGNGWYRVAANATDSNTLGPLLLHASAAGADPVDTMFEVVGVDPDDSAAFGMSRLDIAVSTRSTYGGTDTPGTTTLLSRIASALTITSGKVDVNDKTGFSLVSAYDPAKTAAQVGSAMTLTSAYDAAKTAAAPGAAMTLTSGERTSLSAVIWGVLTSTLTTAGTIGKLIVDNLNAKISDCIGAAGADTPGTTTLLSRIAAVLTITSGKIDVNDKTGFALTSAYDAAKVASSQSSVTAVKVATDKLDTAMELDGAVYRFTTNALEQAPAGGGGSDPNTAAIKAVTDKLDTALEMDGAVYRYTANALEQAPTGTGGGGGATDWSPSERDQIRSRLGLDGSSATPSTTNPLASQTTLLAVKAKTDALPGDPADASDIALSFATVNTKLDGVKLKTDALPPDPADASDIAASFVTVNGKLDTVAGYVDTEVAAIKLKTDNLPADPASQSSVAAIKLKTDALPSDPADASDIAASFAGVNIKLDTIDDYVDTEIAAIKAKTDQLVFTGGKVDANAPPLSVSDMNAIADAVLKRDWTLVSGEAGQSTLNALRSIRNKWSLSVGGVLTVFREDGTTVAWQRSVTSDANAVPVTGML